MIYITSEGKQSLLLQVRDLEKELVVIREEKSFSYSHTGDKWHDNPTFHKLEQDEALIVRRIADIRKRLTESTVINTKPRDTEKVSIGSIVKLDIIDFYGNREIAFYEIVGFQEGEPSQQTISYNSPLGSGLMGRRPGEVYVHGFESSQLSYRVAALYQDWEFADI